MTDQPPHRPTSDKGKMNQGRRPTKRAPLRTGRISKLTPEVSKKICDAVRAGNHLSVAARYAGVGESTLQQWLMRGRGELKGRDSTKLYQDFANDISEAQAASEVAAVLHWRSAMPKDWHAARDYLRVTHPDRWDPDKDKLAPNATAAVQINIGGAQGAQSPTSLPIAELIEDNPAFLKAITPLFDAVDSMYEAQEDPTPVNGAEYPNQPIDRPQLPPITETEPQKGIDAVYDAEEGTWRVIEADNDPNGAE